jgi:hypothetical protein
MIEQKLLRMTLVLFLAAAGAFAQSKCPPLPEGAPCDHYHYHVAVWNIEAHTFSDVAATARFVSLAACEKARAQAIRESTALAEFVRTAIDSSMSANRIGDCHCDRTEDRSSASFLDLRTRANQLRSQQDAAWSLRERLLSRELPDIASRLKNVFGPPPRLDRFFRETMPARVPLSTAPQPVAILLESTVGSHAPTPPIAENMALVAVALTPAPSAPQPVVQPAGTPPPAAPPPSIPAPPVPAPLTANVHGTSDR